VNDRTLITPITLSIAAVERDTGLSKDTLRVWERRYNFPQPERDAIGERAYPLEQVDKLRVVKRLLDAGHRPGRIVPLPMTQLQAMTEQTVDQPLRQSPSALGSEDLRNHLDAIRSHRIGELRQQLARQLMQHGVARFVNEVVAPLNAAVGDAWMRGQLEIFEEHAYTDVMQSVLRQAIGGIPTPCEEGAPVVLLSTFPGEMHLLGLLMAEAILSLEGCRCVSLGTQTPLWDLVLAAEAYRAEVVALSFTGALNPNQLVDNLTELRSKLPATVQVWAGGSAPVLHRRAVEGVQAISNLEQMGQRVRALKLGRP